MTNVSPIEFYQAMFGSRSQEALNTIAETKRFFERYLGDRKWREALQNRPNDAPRLFEEKGIAISPTEVESSWTCQGGNTSAMASVEAPSKTLRIWREWAADLTTLRDHMRSQSMGNNLSPSFGRWRARQARRMSHELGLSTVQAIPNALVAYELSRGCSMGCKFCGVSAAKFAGSQTYDPAASKLWQGILGAMVARFGAAAATGFCYWATDPADNPDYLRFADDHLQITGARPQITTAAPFKNPEMQQDMFNGKHSMQHAPDRISVLSVRTLDLLHSAYTASEMLHIDLVIQTPDSMMEKANAGRHLSNIKVNASGQENSPSQATIACVIGFLINLPERRLRMIAPCRADDNNPDGYITFGDRPFTDVASFEKALDLMLRDVVRESPDSRATIAFNSAVNVVLDDSLLILKSHSQYGSYGNSPFLGRLVELMRGPGVRMEEIMSIIASEYPTHIIAAGAVLQDMFDNGVLVECGMMPENCQEKELLHA